MKTSKYESRRAMLAIGTVIANPRNDRVHPRRQIDMIKESLEFWGQTKPVLVRSANKMLIAGHAIHQALKELGRTEIDCVLWDVDQKTADQFLLADNRLAELGETDVDRRAELLASIEESMYGAVGFRPEEVSQLLEGAPEEIEIYEVDTAPVEDRYWISLRGPLSHQAKALKRLREVMADLGEGVEIELGTIAI